MLSDKIIELQRRREVACPIPAVISPEIQSSAFRVPSSTLRKQKTKAQSWDHRLSDESHGRHSSTLKLSANTIVQVPPINLGVARPNAKYSPWQSMTLCVRSVRSQDATGHEAHSGVSMVCEQNGEEYDLGIAMNYGYAAGSPQLLRFVTEHVELVHDPPFEDWECCLTCGTTSALEMVFRMLCNHGDHILCDAYTYPGAMEAARPLRTKMIGIGMDHSGLLPEVLDATLREWDTHRSRRPHVLYLIPSGQNPTGATQDVERRQAIYDVAEKYDLIIIEDDPYYFLQLDAAHSTLTTENYLDSLPSSYLSLDRSGRVLRLDSTSKILAPGLRCGWLTGCAQLVSKFLQHTEFSTVAPSGPSQVMLYKLLDETWGHDGFFDWLCQSSLQLHQCRDVLIEACDRYLPQPLCTWEVPETGMFTWLRIDFLQHPLAACQACNGACDHVLAIEDRLYEEARANGVLVNKGSWFAVDAPASQHSIAFRMTFAAVTAGRLNEGVRRFGEVIRKEFRMA